MIEPALPPNWWAKKMATLGIHSHAGLSDVALHLEFRDPSSGALSSEALDRQDRHALAALALFGQPFGFAREESTVLRDILARLTASEGQLTQERSILLAVAEKIEALLPPS